jgi:signal transduction histidine kinase
MYVIFQLSWTAAVVVRLRRARGDEVRQMRWLVYAVVIDLGLLVGGVALLNSPVPGLLALPLVPVAAGIAILKYRLYDIDPVINKTIVIGAMVAVITVGYIAVVLGVGALVPAGRGILWLVATSVVAVAAEPLRRRAQVLADRVVYGRRTTPYEALAQLTDGIEGEPEEVLAGVATTVANAVGAGEVVVWVGADDFLTPAAAWPAPVGSETRSTGELHAPGWHVRTVTHRGTVVGALALRKPATESLTVVEDRLLSDLAAQTALIIVHQRHAEELQAAARRIVAAEDAARRRIERNLHDGAQQRLLTLGLDLGVLAERVADDAELTARLRQVRAQLLDATSELRELARGLHPMVVSEQGLQAALEALADRSAVRVELSVALDRRLPPEIEAAAYFFVSEALTNVTRHACATVAKVALRRSTAGCASS